MADTTMSPALLDWKEQGKFITVQGYCHFFRDEGMGDALLLIHGFPTASWDWHRVFEPLAKNFRVIAPDMLGFGFSQKPPRGDYSCKAHAEFHEQLLTELGISNVHILTYSFGSSVVQQMMANELARGSDVGVSIESVTFLNGGLFPGSNHPNLTQKLLLSPLGGFIARCTNKTSLEKNLRKIFGPDTQPDNTLIDDYWSLLCHHNGRRRLPQLIGYLRDRKYYAEPWFRALKIHPARQQLLVGTWDTISGADLAAEYRQRVSGGQLIELEGIGHYPQLECPSQVVQATRQLVLG